MNQVPSILADVLDATSQEMRAGIEKTRAGQRHRGLRGGSAEEIVRDMLREHLPRALGVTIGEVVDSLGNVSGQADVIIYDALRTPMLFSSVQNSSHTVPIEGVIGVIEVKSVLQKKDLPQLIEHARRLADLQKRAYFATTITPTYSFYGRTVSSFPAIYSVFAFESDGAYTEELNAAQENIPLTHRVANMVCLDRGLVINVTLPNVASDPGQPRFSATPVPGSRLAFTTQEDALVPWFAMNSALYVQANIPPINMSLYVEGRLSLHAQMMPSDGRAMLELAQGQLARHLGISAELASKLGTPAMKNLLPEELLELVEAYGRVPNVRPSDDATKAFWDSALAQPLGQRLAFIEAEIASGPLSAVLISPSLNLY